MTTTKQRDCWITDDDGNLTSDGRWTNSWDAENRLVRMESLTNGPSGSKLRLTFGYDHRSRRISKQVESWSGSVWSTTTSNKFLYDGWHLVAVLNGTNNAALQTFLWGSDLSGSMQGAGGVGGLLAVRDVSLGAHFVGFDGNGNVYALTKVSDGTVSANYEYSPFGELLRATGPMARMSPLRFSTKYQDGETDLLYYGFRYYNGSAGRWISSDPLEEEGGENVYAAVRNNEANGIDYLGLCTGCEVQSLEITSRKWIGDWPGWLSRKYSKQLRTEFKLVLKPGSSKSCCLIKQNKKGRVTTASGRGDASFPNWTADLDSWWDGSHWNSTWGGSWSGSTATWRDEPGFNNLNKSDFPVYFGPELAPGTFDFNTYVVDACNPKFPRVAEISWGIYIYYNNPSVGSQHSN